MFENFPYTDMHQLNLDWIVKIAKDFLDQYTQIQQTITDGEDALTAKEAELEETLEAAAEAVAQAVIASIPPDYTALSNKVNTKLGYIDQDLTNTSLNDLTSIGIFETTGSNVSTIANLPPFGGTAENGLILVFQYFNKYVQFYISYADNMWLRYRNASGVWTDWIQVATSANVPINKYTFPENADVNNYTDNGIYKVTYSVAQTMQNLPRDEEGLFIVNSRTGTVIQRYFAINGECYIRGKKENQLFTDWQAITNNFTTRYMAQNDNVDNFTSGGMWRVTGGTAATVANLPVSSAGILIVNNADTAIFQTFVTPQNAIFTRYKSSSGFTPWATPGTSVADWLFTNKVFYRAHQGDKMNAPANSVPAYTLACESDRFDMIQIAVARQSADGTWYVIHDDDVSLTTNGTGNISALHDSYINSLYINRGVNVDQYTHEQLHIPTLAEVLNIARLNNKQVSIRLGSLPNNINTETNKAAWDSFFNLISKYSFKNYILSGNTLDQLMIIRNYGPALCELYITDQTDITTLISTVKARNFTSFVFFKPFTDITEAEVKAAHDNGFTVAVWHDTTSTSAQEADVLAGYDIIQNADI